MKTPNKIVQARIYLMSKQPFWGYLAMLLEPKEAVGLGKELGMEYGTFGTDGKHLLYDPEFLGKCTLPDVQFIFAHEVYHIVGGHLDRIGNRDPIIWNFAIDFSTNDILVTEGFDLPTFQNMPNMKVLYNPAYRGFSAERIYNLLMKDVQKSKSEGGKMDVHQFGDGKDKDGEGEGKEDNKQSQVRGFRLDKTAVQQFKEKLIVAVSVAQQYGKVPAEFQSIIKELVKPSIDWRKYLYQFITEHIEQNDFSWQRLNRRYMAQGFGIPTLRSPSLRPIAVWIDDSCSISDKEVQIFLSEIVNLGNAGFSFDVHIFVGDTETKGYYKYNSRKIDWTEIKIIGRGGTSFVPFFESVKEKQIDPACGIVLTDGDGDFPDKTPGYPVMWVLNKGDREIPFGYKIILENL